MVPCARDDVPGANVFAKLFRPLGAAPGHDRRRTCSRPRGHAHDAPRRRTPCAHRRSTSTRRRSSATSPHERRRARRLTRSLRCPGRSHLVRGSRRRGGHDRDRPAHALESRAALRIDPSPLRRGSEQPSLDRSLAPLEGGSPPELSAYTGLWVRCRRGFASPSSYRSQPGASGRRGRLEGPAPERRSPTVPPTGHPPRPAPSRPSSDAFREALGYPSAVENGIFRMYWLWRRKPRNDCDDAPVNVSTVSPFGSRRPAEDVLESTRRQLAVGAAQPGGGGESARPRDLDRREPRRIPG